MQEAKVKGNLGIMMLCDICSKKVTRLQRGPPELELIDVCDECLQDLSRRQSTVEKHLLELREQMRAQMVTEWQRERTPRSSSGS
jgi:hypothetical protein